MPVSSSCTTSISIHALREEGDQPLGWRFLRRSISIHALREEGDRPPITYRQIAGISIHALREEGDRRGRCMCFRRLHFNPRPPRGGRHSANIPDYFNKLFQSTPSARRATACTVKGFRFTIISIHALREEGDPEPRLDKPPISISIHALREEGDGCPVRHWQRAKISIHALREEGDAGGYQMIDSVSISIHALREEGDARAKIR